MRKSGFPFSMILIAGIQISCSTNVEFAAKNPAEDFSKAVRSGNIESYSFKSPPPSEAKTAQSSNLAGTSLAAAGALINQYNVPDSPATARETSIADFKVGNEYQGDPRLVQQGLKLKRSFAAPAQQFETAMPGLPPAQQIMAEKITMGGGAESARGQLAGHGSSPSPSFDAGVSGQGMLAQAPQQLAYYAAPPPGSQSPYLQGQMSGNPSLWMDSAQNVFAFGDHRAFNPMDIVTIEVNDRTLGRKRANTQTRSEFDLLAGISKFFGIETNIWAANNDNLDPAALVQASTANQFRGEGDMQRQAQLQAQVSAVVLEILPNGVLRIEGSKIVSINAEEEIMVVSGLIRQRDITAENKVDSNRVANMRIDFYGHGTLSDSQGPGWGATIFNKIWPF